MTELDRILDEALAGKSGPIGYDEKQLSKLQDKLARFLSAARLKREHILEEQNKTRVLVSDISHQTKTPLANILLNAQLLEEQPELGVLSRQLAGQVVSGAEKLSFLIQALVKVSRLESGTIQVRPVPGELYALVCAALEGCEARAEQKRIKITVAQEGTAIRAGYDPKWCAEALGNILDNAVKYTPKGGRIDVSFRDYEMFACIRIRDSGKGIADEDLPKIFGRFYRAADSAAAEGVGIGLYLAREIIQQCGGYIQAESRLGQGSTFSVYLSKL